MAPNATHHSPSRVGRVVHRIFPSPRHAIAELAIAVAALALAVPLALHLFLAVVAHHLLGWWHSRRGPDSRHTRGVH
jgi:hypothetical protein